MLGRYGGAVVPVCAALLLAVTALLTVLTPLAALFSRRFFQTVEDRLAPTHLGNAPETGARRVTSSADE